MPDDVGREAEALRADWAAGDPRDPAFRRSISARLEALRWMWRERPSAFDSAALASLRAVSDALRAPVSPAGRADPVEVLRSVFAFQGFRPGQAEIVRAVLSGRDCIGVMPTGAGKSLTYQLPARILGGTALVVSPLIALMKDQVDAMERVGLRATFLNSSLGPEERRDRVERLRRGEWEIVYAAPEGLEASVGSALSGVRLALIAVDEAHCISHWGHDFRPAYRNLSGLKERFGGIPVLALTATATRQVTADIGRQLAMQDPLEFRGSFFRRNLRLQAMRKGEGSPRTRDAVLRLVRARRGESGIVYCLSRRSTEATAEALRQHRIRALAYHAGLDAETRNRVQDAWQAGEAEVIVATVAFGMGIDKPDIRYVLHRDMPRSIEGYYQEIGRAGRDGATSDCVLLYSWGDVVSYDRFSDEADPDLAAWQRRQTREMFRLADAAGCRHQRLVGHFGEAIAPCGDACDRCRGEDLRAEPATALRPRTRPPPAGAASSVTTRGSEARPPPRRSNDGALDLLQALKALRKRLAEARRVPAYVVFPDRVLLEMVERRPLTEEDLLDLSGVGEKKLDLYGEAFLDELRRWAR